MTSLRESLTRLKMLEDDIKPFIEVTKALKMQNICTINNIIHYTSNECYKCGDDYLPLVTIEIHQIFNVVNVVVNRPNRSAILNVYSLNNGTLIMAKKEFILIFDVLTRGPNSIIIDSVIYNRAQLMIDPAFDINGNNTATLVLIGHY